MRLMIFGLLMTACSGPTVDDDVTDTDVDDTDDTTDTDAEETDVSTDTDTLADTDEDPDPGALIFEDSFESPSLRFGDYTEANLTGWTAQRSTTDGSLAAVGVAHLNAGLTSVSPLAAPGEGSQALFLNARATTWARATTEVATMEQGVTYTLTAAVALRNDVQAPSNMSVSFYNSSDSSAVAPETQLRDLIDDTVVGRFQPITVRFTATEEDDGAPLSVRFAILHEDSILSQLVVDSVKVYADAGR